MPTIIGRDDVQRLVLEGAQLVEVLPSHEYGEQHIVGAINMPLKLLDREASARLDPARPVVLYCSGYT